MPEKTEKKDRKNNLSIVPGKGPQKVPGSTGTPPLETPGEMNWNFSGGNHVYPKSCNKNG